MANTQKLIDGFKRFQQHYFGDDKSLYASMVTGQPAKIMMIACCDSRVDPAIVTDCDPGDLFIVRNVANLVPPSEHDSTTHHGTSAALEFANNNLEVESIIIMGHANCGGIRALWDDDGTGIEQTQFIHRWVSIAKPAKDWVIKHLADASNEQKIQACEQRGIVKSLENLMTFSCIRKRVEEGSLKLHGWYFDIPTGNLLCYKPETDSFEAVS